MIVESFFLRKLAVVNVNVFANATQRCEVLINN